MLSYPYLPPSHCYARLLHPLGAHLAFVLFSLSWLHHVSLISCHSTQSGASQCPNHPYLHVMAKIKPHSLRKRSTSKIEESHRVLARMQIFTRRSITSTIRKSKGFHSSIPTRVVNGSYLILLLWCCTNNLNIACIQEQLMSC